MNRNMKARNFGLRSSNMKRALITAYQMKFNGDNTKNSCASALSDFSKSLKEQGINDLRKVRRQHVLAYAFSLNERFEDGDMSPSTVQNYLSKVNVAMEYARMDDNCRVCAVKDAELPSRSGIAVSDKSIDVAMHRFMVKTLPKRLGAQLELQRHLGLRFKESALIDASKMLLHAEATGIIRIEYGTKGGLVRQFSVSSQAQIDALKTAASIQKNDRSLIPYYLSWSQYQAQCYREIFNSGFRFHGERHCYANDRFKYLSGVDSPVRSGIKHGYHHYHYMAKKLNISLLKAKQIDNEVRLQIANELGHGRVNVTNHYLG